jgi:hypothetical protein
LYLRNLPSREKSSYHSGLWQWTGFQPFATQLLPIRNAIQCPYSALVTRDVRKLRKLGVGIQATQGYIQDFVSAER